MWALPLGSAGRVQGARCRERWIVGYAVHGLRLGPITPIKIIYSKYLVKMYLLLLVVVVYNQDYDKIYDNL